MSKNKQPTNKTNSQQSVNKVHQVLQQVTTGPIPSPEILEKYEAIIPGAAERILSMAEREAKHRHQNESKALEANIKIANVNAKTVKSENLLKRRGQSLAVVLYVLSMGVTTYAIYNGMATVASIVGGSTIAFIIGSLLSSIKDKKTE